VSKNNNQAKRGEMGRVRSTHEEEEDKEEKKKNAHGILMERSEGKKPLGRPRRRWMDKIKVDLREIGLGNIDR
jgi:hypothetical protein